MSTTLPKHDTDSEDDSDYVPPADAESDSESSSEKETSKDAVEAPAGETQSEQDEETKKKTRDALWSAFQASLESPAPMAPETKEMVKIEKRYRFAGEDVVEVVEVAADSPDTKKWPLWRNPNAVETPSSFKESMTSTAETSTSTPPTSQPSPSMLASSSSAPPAPAKRPGPRRPKVSLPSLPSSSAKPKKLSTLDKSAMDWRAHVRSEDSHVKDELEANRRSGGYLEKVEFLKRVDERREEAYEASKSTKRRKL